MREITQRADRQVGRRVGYVWRYLVVIAIVFAVVAGLVTSANIHRRIAHAAGGDWSEYLGDNSRSGYDSNETLLTVSTVPDLQPQWVYRTGGNINTQPVVSGGQVYWGSWDGNEYATDLTGNLLWSTPIGGQTQNCHTPALFGVGSTSSVATVSINGIDTQVVFVGGRDPNLNVASIYALDATTGAIIWETPLNSSTASFAWSSPAFYNGNLYMGVSSVNDCPLMQGMLVQLDAVTGTILHTFNVVANGCTGGSIWSSPAIDEAAGIVYVTTGNGGKCAPTEYYAQAIVALNASDLSYVSSWQVPRTQQISDSDFGATPTLFTATIAGTTRSMIGVLNKNGTYYALDRTSLASGPLWTAKISTSDKSIAASAWDGTALYVGGQATTVGGQSCKGSIRALDPATGIFLWETCLSDGGVYAPVTVIPGVAFVGEGPHLIAVATGTGQVLFNYNTSGIVEGAPTVSNGVVYIGNLNGELLTFGLAGSPLPSPTPGTSLAQDTFQRSNQLHWGNATDGQFWEGGANSTSAYSIQNGTGQITAQATTNYTPVLGPAVANAQVTFSGSISSLGSNNMGATLRWTDSGNFYKAFLNGTKLVLQKKVNGVITQLAAKSFPATAGISYTLQFSIVGSALSASAWQTGGTQPTKWIVTATDTALASGFCGVVFYLTTGTIGTVTSFQATAQ